MGFLITPDAFPELREASLAEAARVQKLLNRVPPLGTAWCFQTSKLQSPICTRRVTHVICAVAEAFDATSAYFSYNGALRMLKKLNSQSLTIPYVIVSKLCGGSGVEMHGFMKAVSKLNEVHSDALYSDSNAWCAKVAVKKK